MAQRKTPQDNQYVNWCFTVHNIDADSSAYQDLGALVPDRCRYICAAHEVCPDTGRPHMQGYLQLAKKQRLKQVVMMLLDVLPDSNDPDRPIHPNLEPCKGTPEQNINYCLGLVDKKGNKENPSFVEHGERPGNAGDRERKRFALAAASARAGRFDEIPEDILIRHPGGVRFVYSLQQHQLSECPSVCGIWLYGSPGCGKSFYARELASNECQALTTKFPDAPRRHVPHFKACNKWFDGYPVGGDNVQVPVIMDDFGLGHEVLEYYVKIWADCYPFGNDVKGGTTFMRPTMIIITSNYHPSQIFKDEAVYRAVMRRYKVFRCGRSGNERTRVYEELSGTIHYEDEVVDGSVSRFNPPPVKPVSLWSASPRPPVQEVATHLLDFASGAAAHAVTPPPKLARYDPPRMEPDPEDPATDDDEIILVRDYPSAAQSRDEDSESQATVGTSTTTVKLASTLPEDESTRGASLVDAYASAYEELKWSIAHGKSPEDIALLRSQFDRAAKELAAFEEAKLHGK